ncbi:sarcolemmal membrane-associated protein-like [Topomyia yanbarensis]|uniref:sarcolemmal membrane-associated protein-like n=1 Tax=Topomyia yanbarensis TaxID=2498891 RepID=UPI00273BFFA8|nr:sarcolemmal membrane-associated protein-like [Topomyia yanbarensis]
MAFSFTQSNLDVKLQLDADLEGILKETQNLFQNYTKTQRQLNNSKLEIQLSKDELDALKHRVESSALCEPSDWNRFSNSLNNIIKTVIDRKDLSEYERTVRQLSDENQNMKQKIVSLETEHATALEQEKIKLKDEWEREASQYKKQISELVIHKELAASEASIRNDQLQSRLDRAHEEIETRSNALKAQYEKLLKTLSEQKQQLREENAILQKREEKLREQLEHIQNHSTNYLLGQGTTLTPTGCQRYSQVVETIPFGNRQRASKENANRLGSQRGSQMVNGANGASAASSNNTSVIELAEASSSSGFGRSYRNRPNPSDSPPHPGSGGHITKPRRKRKLFNPTVVDTS